MRWEDEAFRQSVVAGKFVSLDNSTAQAYHEYLGQVTVGCISDLLDAADRVITGFEAPWAKDANGAAVTTRYRLEGNTLVQVVDFDQNTAFPVLADPNFWQVTRCGGGPSGTTSAVSLP